MKKSALPRDMDLDALIEILAQTMRERPREVARPETRDDARAVR